MLCILLPFALLACAEETVTDGIEETVSGIFFKDDEGNTLASLVDFIPGSAVMTFEQGIRMQAIEFQFQDAEKLEEITTDNLHKSIHFYYGENRLASPIVSQVITDGSILINGGFSVELAEELVDKINNDKQD